MYDIIFMLWITVSPVNGEPYSIPLQDPFKTEQACNRTGRFVANELHDDLKSRWPNRIYVFMLECEKQIMVRT